MSSVYHLFQALVHVVGFGCSSIIPIKVHQKAKEDGVNGNGVNSKEMATMNVCFNTNLNLMNDE